jgi:hypothetical protein
MKAAAPRSLSARQCRLLPTALPELGDHRQTVAPWSFMRSMSIMRAANVLSPCAGFAQKVSFDHIFGSLLIFNYQLYAQL